MKLAPLILLPVITLVGVLLSGCSLGQSEADANSSPDPGTAEYLDKEASALADSLGITARPDAELIRMITLDEWAATQIECLNAAGFDVGFTADGEGIKYPPVGDEALADTLNTATYKCEVQYPVSPKYTRPLSDEQLHALYEYRSVELIECMDAEGYAASTPPSETVFMESGGAWSPYESVSLTPAESGDLSKACPQTPEAIYGG